jgi:hypothetical protein
MVLRELLRRGLLGAEVGPPVGIAIDEERDLVATIVLTVRVAVAVMSVVITMPIMLLIDALPIVSITPWRFWGVHSGAVFL